MGFPVLSECMHHNIKSVCLIDKTHVSPIKPTGQQAQAEIRQQIRLGWHHGPHMHADLVMLPNMSYPWSLTAAEMHK